MRRILVAGASIAGLSAARQLRALGFDGEIQVVDADPEAPYRRPEVSKGLLSGKHTRQSVALRWPDSLGLERLSGVRLEQVDLASGRATARAEDARLELAFDGLVIATGCAARRLPLGAGLDGVLALRSVADAERFAPELQRSAELVVVGGGFIGLEVASVARQAGKSVTVIEPMAVPVQASLGEWVGQRVSRLHADQGVRIVTGAAVAAIEGVGRVERVVLTDGRVLPADLVLVAVGAVPAVDWLRSSGLDVADGVRCDPTGAVLGAERVVVAGDVARWPNALYGRELRVEHWANAMEQGVYAAQRLLGAHDPRGFVSAPYFWSEQFGTTVQCLGYPGGYDELRVLADEPDDVRLAYGRAGRLVAIAGIGAPGLVMPAKPDVLAGAAIDSLPPLLDPFETAQPRRS